MKRIRTHILISAIVLSIAAGVVFAASVHLKGSTTASCGGLAQLQVDGALSGLGNGDVGVTVTATVNACATCFNPGNGDHKPPGQNPAQTTVSGTQVIPAGSFKNGNTSFQVRTDAPVTPIAGAPGCPNSSWREDITGAIFTSYSIQVKQPFDIATGTGPVVFTSTTRTISGCLTLR